MHPRKITYSALFLTLAIILPVAFHQVNLVGRMFLPMHIPVMICGFLLGPLYGLLIGIMAPFLSHLLTGMPPTYAVPLMTMELAIYGVTCGLIYKKFDFNIYVALIISMLLGRGAFALGLILLGMIIELPYGPREFIAGGVIITGWPGLIMQIIVIPPIVSILKKTISK